MQSAGPGKIVIQLPSLSWRSLFSFRFFAIVALLLAATVFGYWTYWVRPYVRVSPARLNAFSLVIKSDAAGRIVQMEPQEGDKIKKGELLFSIDRGLASTRYAELQASLASLHQELEFEKGQMGRAMEAYVAAATASEMGIGSPEKIQKQLELMENAQNKSEEIQSKIAVFNSELGMVELELKKGAFAAPFDGVVLKRFHDEGSVVSFGDAVYTVCDPNRLWVEGEVPETEIGRVSIGTPARIQLSAYPRREWIGQVSYIGGAALCSAGLEKEPRIPIKVSLQNPDPCFKPGLSAHIHLKVR